MVYVSLTAVICWPIRQDFPPKSGGHVQLYVCFLKFSTQVPPFWHESLAQCSTTHTTILQHCLPPAPYLRHARHLLW